jgi:prepilin-type N-terminal cleavage/methylation domain-containing protein
MKNLPSRIDRGQKGFSLVELLIAMVLGLILMGGVIAAFLTATGSLAVNREIDRSQESLRFVAILLTDEIRQAVRIGGTVGPFLMPIQVDDETGVNRQPSDHDSVPRGQPGEAVHCNGHPWPAARFLKRLSR